MTLPSERRAVPTLDLVRLAQAGELEAADELFRRYEDRVQKIVRIRLGPRLRGALDSADIRQEAMLTAFQKLGGFEMHEESSLIRWLSRIVENKIHDKLKYHAAQKHDPGRQVSLAPSPGAPSGDLAACLADGRLPTPSVEVGRSQTAEAVRGCIAALPERHREVILLRDYAGCSWEEVAAELGTTPGGARMLHARALNRLGSKLRAEGID